MSHTPGPWTIGRESHPTNPPTLVGYFILGPENERVAGCSVRTSSEENAALIAAAPDLLAACRDVLSQNGLLEGELMLSDHDRAEIDVECCRMLRASIAKAEGK